MTAIEALEEIKEYITKARYEVYDELEFCDKHNFKMESQALQYKVGAYSDISSKVLMMIHELNKSE